jgi:transposase
VHWGSPSESGAVRDKGQQSDNLFSYIRLETRIQADHPLRPIRKLIGDTLRELSAAFSKLYAREGRPSIPPERLLRTVLLQAFYTVGLLMERLEYNHLFCWFVGPSMDDAVWDATVFCKNRDRLLHGDIAPEFMTFSASR